MDVLPALTTRPMPEAYADALAPAAPAAPTPQLSTLDSDLTDGVPVRLALDGSRVLVLAVPLGSARALLTADPRGVLLDDRTMGLTAATDRAPVDLLRPRLTLVADGRIADTVALVPHLPQRLGDGTRALVEVVVDRLVLTAGALRGPGRSDSRITLRWRDLLAAGDSGPAAVPADPALDLIRGATR